MITLGFFEEFRSFPRKFPRNREYSALSIISHVRSSLYNWLAAVLLFHFLFKTDTYADGAGNITFLWNTIYYTVAKSGSFIFQFYVFTPVYLSEALRECIARFKTRFPSTNRSFSGASLATSARKYCSACTHETTENITYSLQIFIQTGHSTSTRTLLQQTRWWRDRYTRIPSSLRMITILREDRSLVHAHAVQKLCTLLWVTICALSDCSSSALHSRILDFISLHSIFV